MSSNTQTITDSQKQSPAPRETKKELHPVFDASLRVLACSFTGSATVFTGVMSSLQQGNPDQKMAIIGLILSKNYWLGVARATPPTLVGSTQKSVILANAPAVGKQAEVLAENNVQLSPQNKVMVNGAIAVGLGLGERLITTPTNNKRQRAANGWATTMQGDLMKKIEYNYMGFANLIFRSSVKIGALIVIQPVIEEMMEGAPISNPMISTMVSVGAASVVKSSVSIPFEVAHMAKLRFAQEHNTVRVPSTASAMWKVAKTNGTAALFKGFHANLMTTAVGFFSIKAAGLIVDAATPKLTELLDGTPLVRDPNSPGAGISYGPQV